MSLRLISIATTLVLLFPQYAGAQVARSLVFNSNSVFDLDETAKFKICGYQFRAQIDEDNWNTMLQVIIYKNGNDDYFASTGLAERSTVKSAWVPKNSIIQWVRVGSAEPLTLDPYNLITTPSRGYSLFSTKKNRYYNLFSEIEKSSVLWVRIFDKSNNSYLTYSGILKINKNVIDTTKQCIENLHRTQ